MIEPSSLSPERRSRLGLAVIIAIAVAAAAWIVVAFVSRQRWSIVPAAVVALGCVVALRIRPAVLRFEVGHAERHHVAVRFDQFWGTLAITVDGKPVAHDLRLFSVRLTKTYTISVGTGEVHAVRIEKKRPLMLAGTRSQEITAYVDDRPVARTSTLASRRP